MKKYSVQPTWHLDSILFVVLLELGTGKFIAARGPVLHRFMCADGSKSMRTVILSGWIRERAGLVGCW